MAPPTAEFVGTVSADEFYATMSSGIWRVSSYIDSRQPQGDQDFGVEVWMTSQQQLLAGDRQIRSRSCTINGDLEPEQQQDLAALPSIATVPCDLPQIQYTTDGLDQAGVIYSCEGEDVATINYERTSASPGATTLAFDSGSLSMSRGADQFAAQSNVCGQIYTVRNSIFVPDGLPAERTSSILVVANRDDSVVSLLIDLNQNLQVGEYDVKPTIALDDRISADRVASAFVMDLPRSAQVGQYGIQTAQAGTVRISALSETTAEGSVDLTMVDGSQYTAAFRIDL